MVGFNCAYCGKRASTYPGAFNRAQKIGAQLYCDKTCSALGRRKNKTEEQLKEEKRLYDMRYRRANREMLKRKKAEYFQRTYDPIKAAAERKPKMARHVEYCRKYYSDPARKEEKRVYDQTRRARLECGEFWESKLLVLNIENQVEKVASAYQLRQMNGTNNKSIKRKRDYARIISQKPEVCPLGNLEWSERRKHSAGTSRCRSGASSGDSTHG